MFNVHKQKLAEARKTVLAERRSKFTEDYAQWKANPSRKPEDKPKMKTDFCGREVQGRLMTLAAEVCHDYVHCVYFLFLVLLLVYNHVTVSFVGICAEIRNSGRCCCWCISGHSDGSVE